MLVWLIDLPAELVLLDLLAELSVADLVLLQVVGASVQIVALVDLQLLSLQIGVADETTVEMVLLDTLGLVETLATHMLLMANLCLLHEDLLLGMLDMDLRCWRNTLEDAVDEVVVILALAWVWHHRVRPIMPLRSHDQVLGCLLPANFL